MAFIKNQTPQQTYATEGGLLGVDPERVRAAVMRRFSPLDGIGQDLRKATTYSDALKISGLGFEPLRKKLVTEDGKAIVGFQAIYNGNNNELLHVVKDDYTIVSNEEAFALAEDLVQYEDFTYEVGSLVNNGARSKLILAGPTAQIGGEDFTPYAVLNNSFDLSKSVCVQFMFMRLACLNGLARKAPGLSSSFNFSHFGNKVPKLRKLSQFKNQFAYTLGYLQREAEVLKNTALSEDEFRKEIVPLVVGHMFGREPNALITERQQARTQSFIESVLSTYSAIDTANFGGTAYKALLAMSDVDSHTAPFVNRSNPDVYINRVLQDGVRLSLANFVANYIIESRHLQV